MGDAKVKMEGTFAARPATRGAKWFGGEGVSHCHLPFKWCILPEKLRALGSAPENVFVRGKHGT